MGAQNSICSKRASSEQSDRKLHQNCVRANFASEFTLPKSLQSNVHNDLREIWLSPNRAAADAAMATFAEKYAPKYGKAVDCLLKDRETLLTFFDFPAEHWTHLRTSDEIDKRFLRSRAIFSLRG
jgi:putative transposase